jgi:predicted ATPase
MLLDNALKQIATGHGQVVSLMAAPGMGKSRLLYEFRQRLTEQHIQYAEGQCLAHGSATPYLPILDLMQDHYGITSDDHPAALTTKLRMALDRCGGDLEVGLPLLLNLLGVPIEADHSAGLSAEVRRGRTFELLWQLLLADSRRQPHVLAVENLHWVDPTSEAFLAGLIERLANLPLLVVTTARPGYRPPWGDKPYVAQLALPPLAPDAGHVLVYSLLARGSLPPILEQQILTKAGGNPLFLEELAHMVREQNGYPPALAVPDTIQAVLAGRLALLPEPEKRLVQVAAVIGNNVPVPLLQATVDLPAATLHSGLAYLQAADFLLPRSFVPTLTYTFKHLLTQEAVYQSLPTTTRRQYHHQIAQALTEHFPSLSKTQPELLAYHYSAAGSTEQAITCWQQAGQLMVERSAYLEAMAHFSTGLALLQDLPDTPERLEREHALQLALAPALLATRGLAAQGME